jgi:hypothetical protein
MFMTLTGAVIVIKALLCHLSSKKDSVCGLFISLILYFFEGEAGNQH